MHIFGVPEAPSSWIDLIDESVHASDDIDIGDVEAISRDFLVVKRGLVSVHRYYIPRGRVEGWDGKVVWLKIPEEQVKRDYARNAAPDPHTYHYGSTPPADTNLAREFLINMPRIPPKYEEKRPFAIAHNKPEEQRIFRCDLCETTFREEAALSNHVASSH